MTEQRRLTVEDITALVEALRPFAATDVCVGETCSTCAPVRAARAALALVEQENKAH